MRRVMVVLAALCVLGTFFATDALAEKKVFYSEREHQVLGIEINPVIERKPAPKGEVDNIYGKYCGVTVLDVQKGSLAEKMGVQKGDFIYRICGVDLIGRNELIDGLVSIRADKENSMDLLRGGAKKHIAFKSDDKYVKSKNYLFLVIHRENKYAERRDLLGILCNTKQTKNMKFFGMLVFVVDVKQLGDFKKSTYFMIINLKEGELKPILI